MIGSFGRPHPGRPGWRTAVAPICIALLSIVGVRAAAAAGAPAAPARPNIILITIDSLRSDRLFQPEGGQHDLPKLEALAKQGIRFDHAYAASPSTAPSNASVLTGLDPSHHGVRHDLEGAGGRLADGVVPLAERLRQAGYETLAVIGSHFLDSDTRLDRGFDVYDDEFPGIRKLVAGLSKERRASEVTEAVRARLDKRTAAKPLFLFANFHDPHADYEAPEPFKSEHKDDPYDGELASLDPQLGALVDLLRDKQLLDRSVLVVAGSHGEALGQHQETGHGIYLYETTVRVPLVIVPFGLPNAMAGGAVVATPVSLTDLAPTLLDLAGAAKAGSATTALDGVSFAGLLTAPAGKGRPKPPREGRPIWIESVQPWMAYGWSPLWAVIDGDHKVVRGTWTESFDLAADPAEEHPIKDPGAKWTRALQAQGQGRLGELEPPPARKKEIDAAAAALGTPWADAPFCVAKDTWPDPRLPEKVAVNGTMFTATIDQSYGIVGRSTRNASAVMETDPDNFSALDMVSFLGIRNRWGDALLDNLELQQCRYPYRMNGYHWLAHYWEAKGETARALKAMDVMQLVDPQSEDPDFDRATIFARQGKVDEAIASLEKAITLGANDFTEMRRDSRLAPLKNDPRFRTLIGLDPLPPASTSQPDPAAKPAPPASGSK
ncbi:MAG TPA: sulfatase [Candidatus Polarisedimenticolia bacterium]|jgi:arylsulfatase A-like enzyme|nr:sulfatase [Candidatus Polarisedimenticolia bacterium]